MTPPKRLWFWMWMIWLGVFVGLEAWAIFDSDRGDTLSEQIWFLQRSWWPLTIILAILLVLLFVHFIVDRRSRKVEKRTEEYHSRVKRWPLLNPCRDHLIETATLETRGEGVLVLPPGDYEGYLHKIAGSEVTSGYDVPG